MIVRKVRVSSTPRFLTCPQSEKITPDMTIVDHDNEAARQGDAAHEYLAHHLLGEELEYEYLAKKHRVSEKEIAYLVSVGRQIWGIVGNHFKQFSTEVSMEMELANKKPESKPINTRRQRKPLADTVNKFLLTGTGDVVGVKEIGDERIFYGLDWKSVRMEEDEYHMLQLLGYALLGCHKYNCTKATVFIGYLRSGNITTKMFAKNELEKHHQTLLHAAAVPDDHKYFIGKHCTYCPRRNNCDALYADTETGISLLTEQDNTLANIIETGRFTELYDRLKYIENLCEAIRQGVANHISTKGSFEDTGYKYSLEDSPKRNIDIRKAFPILKEILGSKMTSAINTSLTAIEKAAKKVAEPGKAAALNRKILEELEEAEAITTTYGKKFTQKKLEEQSE